MPSILVGVNLDGNITHFNLQAEKETGIKENQAIGKKLETILPRFSNGYRLIWLAATASIAHKFS